MLLLTVSVPPFIGGISSSHVAMVAGQALGGAFSRSTWRLLRIVFVCCHDGGPNPRVAAAFRCGWGICPTQRGRDGGGGDDGVSVSLRSKRACHMDEYVQCSFFVVKPYMAYIVVGAIGSSPVITRHRLY